MSDPGSHAGPTRLAQRLMTIAWPAFLAACVLELVVFAVVDPLELHWAGHDLGWSRQSVYTVAFFVFWLVTMGACALAAMLGSSPAAEPELRP